MKKCMAKKLLVPLLFAIIFLLLFAIILPFLLTESGKGTPNISITANTGTFGETELINSKKTSFNKKLSFGIVVPVTEYFFEPVTDGVKDQLKKMGVDADIICEAAENADIAQQIKIMNDLINRKVSGIAICASDSDAITPSINKAVEEGIPVVSFDTDAPESKRIAYIGTNNYNAGIAMGEVIGKALKGQGKVICETGIASQAGLNQRIEGVEFVLQKKYPDIKIIKIKASNGNGFKCGMDIEEMISTFPDFDALIIMDASGDNGVTSFKSRGWTTQDKILITFDDMPYVIKGVKDGQVYTTITQCRYDWGVNIAQKLYDLSQGKQIPENTDTGYLLIDQNNVFDKYPD